MPTFFINGTSLSNSTAVFLDSEQLICAPDGYYSDGVITREQSGCILLPQIACPSCGDACPVITQVSGEVTTSQRIRYSFSLTLGTETGAVIIDFNPLYKPDGIIAELDGTYYNELSLPVPTYGVNGYVAAPPNLVTYFGRDYGFCFCDDLPTTGCTYTLEKRAWNGSSFILEPGTETINILQSQVIINTSGGWTGEGVMVIPKPSSDILTLNVYVYSICPLGTFYIKIGCVEPLPTFQASDNSNPSLPEFCTLPIDNTFYVAKVNNIPAYPLLAVTDWVFQDENGEFKLSDGYYKTNDVGGGNNTIEVANGIIVAITFSPCD